MSLNNWAFEQTGPAAGLNSGQPFSESSSSLVYLLQVASDHLGSGYLLTLAATGAIAGCLALVSLAGLHVFLRSDASSQQKRDIAFTVLPAAYILVALLASAASLLSAGFDTLMPVLLTMVVFLAVDAFYVQLPRLRSMHSGAANGNGTAIVLKREIIRLVGGHALQVALILVVAKRLLLV